MPRRRDASRRRGGNRGGFVVFGMLLLIVGSIVAAVMIGLVVDRVRQGPSPPPVAREIRYAGEVVEVRFGALTTSRYVPGDRLWVRPAENGAVAVFENAASNRILGFAPESRLLEMPPEGVRIDRAPRLVRSRAR